MDAKPQANRIQNGQEQATSEWKLQLLERVMRFGFQNGVPAYKMNAFQRTVFEDFSSTALEIETETDIQLYKAAISNLHPFTGDEKAAEEVFRFPEDHETHEAILELATPS